MPMAFRQLLEAQVKVISHFSSFPALVLALHLTTITYVTVARPDHNYSPAELNYDVHDKEMVVIVDCMREWQHMLVGAPERVVVYTDHRNLEYFQKTKDRKSTRLNSSHVD